MLYDILFAFACIFLIFYLICFVFVRLHEKRSMISKLGEKALFLSRVKRHFANKEKFEKILNKRKIEQLKPYTLPKLYKLRYKAIQNKINNLDYITINQKGDSIILYFHGGAFLNPITIMHYEFLDKLALSTNSKIYIPIYKRIPDHNVFEAVEEISFLYEHIKNKYPNNEIYAMGDSAGGSLLFSFYEHQLKKNIIPYEKIFLLSPWLDLTMANEKIEYLEKKDPMLSKYGLKECAKMWLNQETLDDNNIVSPFNQDLSGLKEINLFIGTHELFLEDARLFYEKFKSKNEKNKINLNYYEYNRMNHDFILYNVPESKDALKKIEELIIAYKKDDNK